MENTNCRSKVVSGVRFGKCQVQVSVPAMELEKVEAQVERLIQLEVDGVMVYGTLKSVTTTKVKIDDDTEIFKRLTIELENIANGDGFTVLELPDKKCEFENEITFTY